MRRYLAVFIWISHTLLMAACKKNGDDGSPSPPNGTRLELSLDSLYLYAKETYLWHTDLPDYATFHPRQYTNEGTGIENLTAALSAITQLTRNPQTNHPYEFRQGFTRPLYSYIAEGNIITGRKGEADLMGKASNTGLGLAVVNGAMVYVRYVERGSPAAMAGITRGMKVLQINHQPASASIAALNALLDQSPVTLKLERMDGQTMEPTLVQETYIASPVLRYRTLMAGTKKTGYLALARFSVWAGVEQEITRIFQEFSQEGVTHLVIDLRYNGGGYVESAENLANLIAPAGINNQVMYASHYNALMQQGKANILKSIPYLDNNGQPVYINGRQATYADVDYTVPGNTAFFKKAGPLTSVKSIVFIVSGATASASELLINSFRPYVEVKLVGSKTFGKPVGFFGIGIDVYTAYLSQFRMVNAAGQGDYYEGMPADITAIDDVTRNFGDPDEASLSAALQYISGGPNRQQSILLNGKITSVEHLFIQNVEHATFNGMLETRHRLR